VLDFSQSKLHPLINEIEKRGEIIEFTELYKGSEFVESKTLREAADRLAAGETLQIQILARVESVRFDIYIERWRSELFSLELVFWADYVFPKSQSEDANRDCFRRIVQFSLDLCQIVNGRKIILTGEWNGNPYELEASEHQLVKHIVWER
jgi:hypothetical protein